MNASLALFALAAFAVVAIPGPDVLYVTATSLEQGREAGIVSAASAATAGIALTASVALGLAPVLASSELAFRSVKYIGAAYLIYLGVRRLRDRAPLAHRLKVPTSKLHVFTKGFMISVSNPKTGVFFVAFLPQFVTPRGLPVQLQLLVLGALFVAIGFLSDTAYAMLSATAASLLRRRRDISGSSRYLAGGTLITLGVIAALAQDPLHSSARGVSLRST